MSKITFKSHIIFGIIMILLGNLIAILSDNGIFSNIAWILYGSSFLVHPSYPLRLEGYFGERKAKLMIRILGILCIMIGFCFWFVP